MPIYLSLYIDCLIHEVTFRNCSLSTGIRTNPMKVDYVADKISIAHGMEDNSELQDWLYITSSFVNDIVECHSFQTCNIEMKQRIKHLLFIIKVVREGDNAQLAVLFEEHESLLVMFSTFLQKCFNYKYFFCRVILRMDPFRGQVNCILRPGKNKFRGGAMR